MQGEMRRILAEKMAELLKGNITGGQDNQQQNKE
jgi:hypothetical protein